MVYSIKADPVRAQHWTNSSSNDRDMYIECTNGEVVCVNSCNRVMLNAPSAPYTDIFMGVRLNRDNIVHIARETIQAKKTVYAVTHGDYLVERKRFQVGHIW